MVRLIAVAAGVLLVIIAVGFVDCAVQSATCTKDPCWSLWLGCAVGTINSRLVVALIAAGIAAWLTYQYQRRGKIWEFKFSVYREAAPAYLALRDAGRKHVQTTIDWLVMGENAQTPEAYDVADKAHVRAEVEFEVAIRHARSLVPSIAHLFGPVIAAHWRESADFGHRTRVVFDPVVKWEELKGAEGAWSAFIKGAAEELHLPFAETAADMQAPSAGTEPDQIEYSVKLYQSWIEGQRNRNESLRQLGKPESKETIGGKTNRGKEPVDE